MDPTIVKSTQRVFEILEAFERCQRPMALSELAAELHYPTSSTAALLKSLVNIGYLSYDKASHRYLPTTRINTLGRWIPQQLSSEGANPDIMRRLSEVSGEAVTLCAQSDIFVQYVHVVDCPDRPCAEARVGTLRPLATTGTGIALLSAMDASHVEKILRRINHAMGRNDSPKVDASTLGAALAHARRDGHVFTKHVGGMASLAVPMPLQPGGRQFVVAVIGPAAKLEQKAAAILAVFDRAEA